MKFDNISDFMGKLGSSFASVAKVAILSKAASHHNECGKGKDLVIMGNGPSLSATIDNNFDFLVDRDLMAVNFAALSEEFIHLRPRYYIMADGHFFNSLQTDNNVRKLWDNLGKISWDMTLLVPIRYRHFVAPLLMNAKNIKMKYYNLTPIEGFKWLNHIFFSMGLGMPRPRNVLIPAIMEGMRMGYKKIFIVGADHTWTKTLDVDNENFVVSVQPHFYKDNEEEHKRVRETYKGIRLHEVLGSMAVAFKSYWEIAAYAGKKGICIFNATPGSMIDAFPRYNPSNM